jgi:Double sensory domain of two-component sensor kinase
VAEALHGRGATVVSEEPPTRAQPRGRASTGLARLFNSPRDEGSLLPQLLVAGLLALVVTYAAVNLVVGALGEKFRDDLTASRLSASKAMVRLEEDNLRTLRQMTFTEGVDQATADDDTDRLERLLAPIAANGRVPYVEVLRADGTELLALRLPELGPEARGRLDPGASRWSPLVAVLRGAADDQGDKFADIVVAPWGPLFATAAPLYREGALVGAIAVAQPMEDVATRLSDDSGSQGITLYRLDGTVLATTIRAAPEGLQRGWRVPTGDVERVMAGDQVLLRQLSADGAPFVETVGALAIRRRAAGLLGISSPAEIIDRSSTQTRNWMLVIFGVAVALLLGLRLLVDRGAAAPPVPDPSAAANGTVGAAPGSRRYGTDDRG